MRGMLRMALLFLAAVVLIGCAGSSVADATATTAPTSSSTATRKPTSTPYPTPTPYPSPTLIQPFIGSEALDFAFELFQGASTGSVWEQLALDGMGRQELRLDDLKGTPIVLNFWARFCTPCWTEMPELQDFYEEHGDEVVLLGIDLGQFTGLGSPKDASRLLGSLGVTYPAGYTDDGEVVKGYRVQAMPTTIFITAEGEIYRAWSGSIDRETVEAIVAGMLGQE